MKKVLNYIEPLWCGTDGKISIRRVLSLVFAFNLVSNASKALVIMSQGKSIAEVTMLLGVEAGLIAALLSLTTYSNILAAKKDKE